VNPRLLYAGTEFGFFVSLDDGGSWERFMPNLPVVRIDDVLVHPRDNDLVLDTPGPSVWILDDVSALQAMTPEVMGRDMQLFGPRQAVSWKRNMLRSRAVTGNKNWTGENAPPGTAIQYYLADAAGEVGLQITDAITGEVVRDLEATGTAGLNRVQWNLRANPQNENQNQGPAVAPGTYRVTLRANGMELSALVEVLEDVWMSGMQ